MGAKKQADRNATKRALKQEKAGPETDSSEKKSITDVGKALILESCVVTYGVQLKDLIPEVIDEVKATQKTTNGNSGTNGSKAPKASDEDESEKKEDAAVGEQDEPVGKNLFESLKDRLTLKNGLGLGAPLSKAEADEAWVSFVSMKWDFGPRPSKRGSPKYDRVVANVAALMPQYFHLVLLLMTVRAFLGRSFFSLLPWLQALQLACMLAPVEALVPKATPKMWAVVALTIHAFMWFMFIWEVVLKTYFIEKLAVVALIIFHAHSVRPVE